jgi:hypothetical protein
MLPIAVFVVKTKCAMIAMMTTAAEVAAVRVRAVVGRIQAMIRTPTNPMTKRSMPGLAAKSLQQLAATMTCASDRENKLQAAAPATQANLLDCAGYSGKGR